MPNAGKYWVRVQFEDATRCAVDSRTVNVCRDPVVTDPLASDYGNLLPEVRRVLKVGAEGSNLRYEWFEGPAGVTTRPINSDSNAAAVWPQTTAAPPSLPHPLGAIDYMHARFYSAAWGRFLSVVQSATASFFRSPQPWNRYSYALNNPVNISDPTDLDPCRRCRDRGSHAGTRRGGHPEPVDYSAIAMRPAYIVWRNRRAIQKRDHASDPSRWT